MNDVIKKKTVFSSEMCGSPYLLFLIVCYVSFEFIGAVGSDALIVFHHNWLTTGGTLCFPIILLIEDVIAEVYGYKIARLLIWFFILSTMMFVLGILVIIHLPSPGYWYLRPNLLAVFDPWTHRLPACILGYLASFFLNIYLITKLKIILKGRFFWLRSVLSTLPGGFIAPIIYFSLAYGSNIPLTNIEKLIVSDFTIRFLYAALGGIPASLFVSYLKKKENIDVYDTNTNFNPFKLSLKD